MLAWCRSLSFVASVTSLAAPACQAPGARPEPRADEEAARVRMVDEQLRARDISSARVLEAMRKVPRHRFIPDAQRERAYDDSPVPIGLGQTISQPYIVAFMTQALEVEPGHRVLEIGTGSGYQAAVLAERARATLAELGYGHIRLRTGNGYLGWPEHAPFDRIIVTAAPPEVPPALVQQLKIGGLMAIPVGTTDQQLLILRRTAGGMETLRTLPVRFVPMVDRAAGRVPDFTVPGD